MIKREAWKHTLFLTLFPAGLGGIFAMGFSPFSHAYVAYGALVVLFISLWLLRRVKDAALLSFCFGLGWFSIGLSWVMNSMTEHGRLPWIVALLGLLLLSAVLSLFPAVAGALSKRILRQSAGFPFFFAGLLVLAEGVRGNWLLNFGWLTPAYALLETPLASLAAIGGVHGVNLIFFLSAGLAASLIIRFLRSRRGVPELLGLIGVVLAGYGVHAVEWSSPGAQLEVRMIQPNLPVVDAWARVNPAERIRQLLPLADGEWKTEGPRLTVTPEGVVNSLIERLDPDSVEGLIALQKRSDSPVLFNGFRRKGENVFNTEFLFSDQGIEYGLDKRYLVPFGEFVPVGARWFVDLLGIPMSDLTSGALSQPLMQLDGVSIGVLICYENLYGSLSRVYSSQNLPNVLVVTANLGWFSSAIIGQHLDMSRMRALEIARPLIQVNNTGLSAVVNSKGQLVTVLSNTGPDSETIQLRGAVGAPTPYVKFGDWLALISTGLLLILSFFGCRKSQ